MAVVTGPQPPLRVPDLPGLAPVSSLPQGGQPSHKKALSSLESKYFRFFFCDKDEKNKSLMTTYKRGQPSHKKALPSL